MSSNVIPILSSSPPPIEETMNSNPYPIVSSSPPPLDCVEAASDDNDFDGFQAYSSFDTEKLNNGNGLFGEAEFEDPVISKTEVSKTLDPVPFDDEDDWADFVEHPTEPEQPSTEVDQFKADHEQVTTEPKEPAFEQCPSEQPHQSTTDPVQLNSEPEHKSSEPEQLPSKEEQPPSEYEPLPSEPEPSKLEQLPSEPEQLIPQHKPEGSDTNPEDNTAADLKLHSKSTEHDQSNDHTDLSNKKSYNTSATSSHSSSSPTNIEATTAEEEDCVKCDEAPSTFQNNCDTTTTSDSNSDLTDSANKDDSDENGHCDKVINTKRIITDNKDDVAMTTLDMCDSNSSRDSGLCSDMSENKLSSIDAESVENEAEQTTNEQDADELNQMFRGEIEKSSEFDSNDVINDSTLKEDLNTKEEKMEGNDNVEMLKENSVSDDDLESSDSILKGVDNPVSDAISTPVDNESDDGDFGSFKDTTIMDDLQFRMSTVDSESNLDLKAAATDIEVADGFTFEDPQSKEGLEQDEDDDFGGFTGGVSGNDDEGAGTDDGWAAFATADDQEKEEEWAAFSGPDPVNAKIDDINADDDDEFTSFDDAPVVDMETTTTGQSSLASVIQSLDLNKLNDLLSQGFSLTDFSDDNGNNVVVLLNHIEQSVERTRPIKQQPGAPLLPTRSNQPKTETIDISVWNNLKNVENTDALQYTWNKSVHNKKLLHAINIDTRNILGRKKAVPIYASQMITPANVLQPTDTSSVDKTVLDSASNNNSNVIATPTAQDLPPVEFDWSSSGLTNPLDSSDLQLDLDFFQQHVSIATSPTAVLENELLRSIEPSPQQQPRTLQPLDDVIASMKITPTAPIATIQAEKGQQLSLEAQALVDKLPDISYMCSSVLMFAVHE